MAWDAWRGCNFSDVETLRVKARTSVLDSILGKSPSTNRFHPLSWDEREKSDDTCSERSNATEQNDDYKKIINRWPLAEINGFFERTLVNVGASELASKNDTNPVSEELPKEEEIPAPEPPVVKAEELRKKPGLLGLLEVDVVLRGQHITRILEAKDKIYQFEEQSSQLKSVGRKVFKPIDFQSSPLLSKKARSYAKNDVTEETCKILKQRISKLQLHVQTELYRERRINENLALLEQKLIDAKIILSKAKNEKAANDKFREKQKRKLAEYAQKKVDEANAEMEATREKRQEEEEKKKEDLRKSLKREQLKKMKIGKWREMEAENLAKGITRSMTARKPEGKPRPKRPMTVREQLIKEKLEHLNECQEQRPPIPCFVERELSTKENDKMKKVNRIVKSYERNSDERQNIIKGYEEAERRASSRANSIRSGGPSRLGTASSRPKSNFELHDKPHSLADVSIFGETTKSDHNVQLSQVLGLDSINADTLTMQHSVSASYNMELSKQLSNSTTFNVETLTKQQSASATFEGRIKKFEIPSIPQSPAARTADQPESEPVSPKSLLSVRSDKKSKGAASHASVSDYSMADEDFETYSSEAE